MIIFREKEYSSKALQALATMKRAGNRAMVSIDNAGLSVSNKLLNKQGLVTKFKPKTKYQINRETIGAGDAAKRKIQETKLKAIDTL